MRIAKITLGLIFGLALVIVSSGHAYDGFPTPEDMGLGYTFTGGVALMVNGDMSNNASPTFGVAWYGPLDETAGDMAALGLSADWIGLKRNDGKKVSLVPVFLNYKRSGLIGQYRVFVNLGLGIQVASDDVPVMKLDDGISFAWTGGLGFDITNSVYMQAKFIGGNNPGQDGLVSLDLGYRF
ncbi:MAG: hypothetical protein ACOX3G_10145 [Armatimonadota bacterium]|jgi:hypothetical protein